MSYSNLVLNSADVNLVLIGEEAVLKRITKEEFLKAYIPNVTVSLSNEIGQYPTLSLLRGQHNSFSQVGKTDFVYTYTDTSSKDMVSCAEYCLEYLRQYLANIVCIHGACAVYKQTPVVFWGGASGMGKTRLAMALGQQGKFLYDEKILINLTTGRVVGGVRYQYNNKLFYKDLLGTKKYRVLQSNREEKVLKPPVFIYGFARDRSVLEISCWEKERFEWHMYEEMSRKIRGTSRRFFDFSYPAPSLDNQELALKRLQYCQESNAQAYYLSGSEKEVTEYITQEII